MSVTANSQIIKSLVDQYQLEADGVKFWTPYFINSAKLSPDPDNFKPGPYKGKGTPKQLQAWVNLYAKSHPSKRSSDEWHKLLISMSVGIECSGFVYYILDSFLAATGNGRLWDQLFIPKQDLLNAFNVGRAPRGVTRQQIESGPNQYTMHQFCTRWGKDPRRNTNVTRLVDTKSSNLVGCVGKAQPGDLVVTSGPAGDHIGIITEIGSTSVTYADSIGLNLKGVSIYQITITNPNAGLEQQDWGKNRWYIKRYKFHGLRRLKVLDAD